MKHYLTLLSHEVRMLLVNPSTYIAAVMFLGVMGFMFTGILESYSKTPQDTSPAHVFFSIFWFPVLFIVPLLTMKCLAEERRLGTIETLLTTPVTTTEVVLANTPPPTSCTFLSGHQPGDFSTSLKNSPATPAFSTRAP